MMGVREIDRSLEQWQMRVKDLRRRMILAPTPRERERWYAMLLLAQGLTAAATAEVLERDPHTVGALGRRLRRGRTHSVDVRAVRGLPPALGEAQQTDLKAAVQEPPAESGIELANWNWTVVRQFVSERYCIGLRRSSCLNWLHRLGFALKRPKKRLLKADAAKREAFVAEYAALWHQAHECGAKIFFADEAHFRADVELRGKWVLKGEPALMNSSSPRYGEKASYYSAVCLETGEVEWMELDGNSNSGTSAAFLEQLREGHTGPLTVIWGQRAGAPWRGGAGVLADTGVGTAAGEPAGIQSRTSTPMRRSGAGRERRRMGTCAWGPKTWYRRGLGTSSTGCAAGKTRSSAAAEPSCSQGPGLSGETSRHFPRPRQMHIPPWLCSLSHKATNGLAGDWRCGKFTGYGRKGDWAGSTIGWQSFGRLWDERGLPLEVQGNPAAGYARRATESAG